MARGRRAVHYIIQTKKSSTPYHHLAGLGTFTMDPDLQLLYAYDINHHINALADSIQMTWKLEYVRDRAVALIGRFIHHKAPGFVTTDMTVERVTSITFHCMLTPIHFLSPQAAQTEAVRILHNMNSLFSCLDAQRKDAIQRLMVNRAERL